MQIVSLTTDFGNTDYYVGELKGAIYDKKKDINIIDISHSVESYDLNQAAFFVNNVFRSFPEKTIHVLAVYNYYRKQNEFIVLERENHFFIGPNNGVFSLIFDDLREEEIYSINLEETNIYGLPQIIAHGIACIAHDLPFSEFGKPIAQFVRKINIQPVVTNSQIRATIIHIDHFENVIINLKKELFNKIRNGRKFSLYFKQTDPIDHISRTYSDVPIGETLCFFNASGFLELAINMGKASSMFNLNRNETIQINFH